MELSMQPWSWSAPASCAKQPIATWSPPLHTDTIITIIITNRVGDDAPANRTKGNRPLWCGSLFVIDIGMT
jgi:hypothetical protein